MRPRRLIAAQLAILACLSCGDDTTNPDDDFLPIFTNIWRNTRDLDHTFFFNSTDDGQASGTVEGTETLNFVESELEGTFQNSVVTNLTIHRESGDKVYTGKFLHPDFLVLTSGTDSITLFRPR